MWVMSSVLSPLIERMVSPAHRSPWAALLPGVTYRGGREKEEEAEEEIQRGTKRKTYYQ